MRDALLMFVVGTLSVVGLLSPRFALMGYVWFSLFRPDVLAFSPVRPYSAILACVTLIGAFRGLAEFPRLIKNPWVLMFAFYFLWSSLSVLFADSVELCFPNFTTFLTISAITFVIPLLVVEKRHLIYFLATIGGSIGLLGAKMGTSGILAGGARFVQGYGGLLADNNLIALALVTVLPLLWRSMLGFSFLPVRACFAFSVLTTLAAIVMCHSRGGVLALAVVLMLLALKSKYKFAAIVTIGLLTLPGVFLVRDSITERMATLGDVQSDASASGRIAFWKTAVRVGLDHPLLGVGFGGENYRIASSEYLGDQFNGVTWYVHNTYLQIFADSGAPALLSYCLLLFGAIIWLGKYAKRAQSYDKELSGWAESLRVSLVGYAIGAVFLSRVYFDLPYFLIMAVGVFWSLDSAQSTAASPTLSGVESNCQAVSSGIPSPQIGPIQKPDSQVPTWKRPGAGRRVRRREHL